MAEAAEAGFSGAADLYAMTPREAELALCAFAARERRRWERIDAAAWLAARYAVIGWHAPRRFPKRPEGVRRREEAMSDAAMKAVFEAISARKNEDYAGEGGRG